MAPLDGRWKPFIPQRMPLHRCGIENLWRSIRCKKFPLSPMSMSLWRPRLVGHRIFKGARPDVAAWTLKTRWLILITQTVARLVKNANDSLHCFSAATRNPRISRIMQSPFPGDELQKLKSEKFISISTGAIFWCSPSPVKGRVL